MSWERGRSDLERLITDGELARVAPSAEVAGRLLADARAHIMLAAKGTVEDPLAPSNSAMTPPAKPAPRCSSSRASGQRPGAATSRSWTPSEASSTTAAARRSSVESTRCDDDRTAPSTLMMTRSALDTARAILDAAQRILDSGALDLFE